MENGFVQPPPTHEHCKTLPRSGSSGPCDPFLATGVSLGDEIRVERVDDRLWFSEKVNDSGNSTVAIYSEEQLTYWDRSLSGRHAQE
ncbi:DUF4265 domain-containing protein [Streptomyces sp. NPDC002994]|uniref:DUF4265 domain-containing protein n=1 Tax=Streptomyces sp. NPDC002994 TaxID=3154441 RepID=UPI0033B93E57